MKITMEEIRSIVDESEMILIGLGEEFEGSFLLKDNEKYIKMLEELKECNKEWMIPYVTTIFLRHETTMIAEALDNLSNLLEGKNFFLVSTCMNGFLQDSKIDKNRIVEPCGGYLNMQCKNGCNSAVCQTSTELLEDIEKCYEGIKSFQEIADYTCTACGESMVLNNIYAENYIEEGYLQQWEIYKKWLQGTVNRKLCILELGVGMKYPTVIRWPFEKVAFYNKKSKFIRANEKLYQLTPELAENGYFVTENAVKLFVNPLVM